LRGPSTFLGQVLPPASSSPHGRTASEDTLWSRSGMDAAPLCRGESFFEGRRTSLGLRRRPVSALGIGSDAQARREFPQSLSVDCETCTAAFSPNDARARADCGNEFFLRVPPPALRTLGGPAKAAFSRRACRSDDRLARRLAPCPATFSSSTRADFDGISRPLSH